MEQDSSVADQPKRCFTA